MFDYATKDYEPLITGLLDNKLLLYEIVDVGGVRHLHDYPRALGNCGVAADVLEEEVGYGLLDDILSLVSRIVTGDCNKNLARMAYECLSMIDENR